MKNNNWTSQLLSLEIGDCKEFSSEFYESILSQRRKLEMRGKGVWTTKKERGSLTFKARRVE